MKFHLILFIILSCCLLACQEEKEVKIYSSGSEENETQLVEPANPSSSEQDISTSHPPTRPSLDWKQPEGWQEEPGSSMRLASYQVKSQAGEVDIAAFIFPDGVGGLLANINRWRNQMSLDPFSNEEELAKNASKVQLAGHAATLVDFTGNYVGSMAKGMGVETKKDYRFVGIYAPTPRGTIVIKMVGPAELVAENRDEFEEFYQSFQFNEKN